nr:MAG TPA: hypothetical protein [Caudoviricetes sp.]
MSGGRLIQYLREISPALSLNGVFEPPDATVESGLLNK